MTNDPHLSHDTPTGTDPDAEYEGPGYEDKSFGQATAQDAELAEELVAESADADEAERRFESEAVGAPARDTNPADDPPTVPDREQLLSVYLSDHAAGARAGIALSERSRKSNEGTSFAAPLAQFHDELVRERASLERFMAVLGCQPSKVKDTLGLAGVWLGQLKLSGRLISYSPVSRVLELEALIGAVGAKRRLWDALKFVDPEGSLPAGELSDLIEAADRQIAELERLHRAAVTIAFGGDSTSSET